MDQKQLVELEQEGKLKITRLSKGEKLELEKALNPVYDHLSKEIGQDLVNRVIRNSRIGE